MRINHRKCKHYKQCRVDYNLGRVAQYGERIANQDKDDKEEGEAAGDGGAVPEISGDKPGGNAAGEGEELGGEDPFVGVNAGDGVGDGGAGGEEEGEEEREAEDGGEEGAGQVVAHLFDEMRQWEAAEGGEEDQAAREGGDGGPIDELVGEEGGGDGADEEEEDGHEGGR